MTTQFGANLRIAGTPDSNNNQVPGVSVSSKFFRMTTTTLTSQAIAFKWIAPIIATFVIVTFLFYIDEGYYNFNWTLEIGSWIVFAMYAGILFPIQYVMSYFFFRKSENLKRMVIYLLIAIPVSIFILLFVVFK